MTLKLFRKIVNTYDLIDLCHVFQRITSPFYTTVNYFPKQFRFNKTKLNKIQTSFNIAPEKSIRPN